MNSLLRHRRLKVATALATVALGMAGPPRSAAAEQPLIRFRLDVRNLTSDDRRESLSNDQLKGVVEQVNAIYSRCQIEFVSRFLGNIPASSLKIPFPPKSEADLITIASHIHPRGFKSENEALPLTFAGAFSFYSPTYKLMLFGLTWTFLESPGQITRMHSFIGRQHLDGTSAVEIVAHELGHFFLLPHSDIQGNVMGSGRAVTETQCQSMRTFAATYYQPLIER